MNRREFIGMGLACGLFGGCVGASSRRIGGFGSATGKMPVAPRRVAINASTVRGYGLSLKEQVKAAVAAGCRGYEPWLKDVHAAKQSGEFADAVKIARDNGLEFINGIAFGQWANPDGAIRAAGLEETKRDMAALAEMGCPYVAASMFGVHKPGAPALGAVEIADRYGPVCDLGEKMGVRPLLEYWGHSVNMNRLEDALTVLSLVENGDTAVLADVYHTYRGGGDFATFRELRPGQLPVLHVNDYPLTKPRTELVDADRVWPGDGVAPWNEIFAALETTGLDPWLSVEVFNPSYWRSTPVETMREALKKASEV